MGMTNFDHLVPRQRLRELPPLQWLVRGFVPLCETGTLGMIWGLPGSYKSFATIGIACSVATGKQCWGSVEVQQHPVVYVVAEGVADMQMRVEAWEACARARTDDMLFLLCRSLRVMDADDCQSLADDMRELPVPPRLVVLDTWSRCLQGADENQSSTVEQAIANLDVLRQEFGAAVLLIHHSDKAGIAARGSIALKGAVDFEFEMRREEGAESALMVCRKTKYSAAPEPAQLAAIHVADSLVVTKVR